jgi:hypothetical protein
MIAAVHVEPSRITERGLTVPLIKAAAHSDIAEVEWRDPVTGNSGYSRRQDFISWLNENPLRSAYAEMEGRTIDVRVVADRIPPELHAFVEGEWTDDLLRLPRY